MTICDKMKKAVQEKIDAGYTIEQIGKDYSCVGTKYPTRKGIRLVRDIYGDQWMIDNAEKIKYKGVGQLKSAKQRKEEKLQKFALEHPEIMENEPTIEDYTNWDNELDDIAKKLSDLTNQVIKTSACMDVNLDLVDIHKKIVGLKYYFNDKIKDIKDDNLEKEFKEQEIKDGVYRG
ncbi:MAG: hypothetical protein FIB08_03730 [Candidatus Methanoperedens sp.]|nr:hypothetical protein [Candidatus Methanoperedens sp.]